MAYIQGLAESKKGDAGSTPASTGGAISPAFARELLERSGSLKISAECLARVRDILGRIANGQTVSESEIDFVATVESNPNCATVTESGMAWWLWAALASAALFVVMGGNKKK